MKTLYVSNQKKDWSKNEISTLTKYSNKLYDEEQRITADRLLNKQVNQVSFYKITPKKDLPKNLQKMSFQSLNTKQSTYRKDIVNGNSIIKVYHKQPMTEKQNKVRKIMKQNGQILMLSQIYDYFDDQLQQKKIKENKQHDQIIPLSNIINQLDQWEKNINKNNNNINNELQKVKLPTLSNMEEIKNKASGKKQKIIKKFKIGSDYSDEIIKNLEIINNGYNNNMNIIGKYTQIEINSKLLKKQLEEMKQYIKKQIDERIKKLYQIRKQHHKLYQQKQKLYLQQQEYNQQKKNQNQSNNYQITIYNKVNQKGCDEKKIKIEKNEIKINKIKKNIECLQEQKYRNQEQLKNILKAQKIYYKISLKCGLDCRENGLVWLIKKLNYEDQNMISNQFPQYLDKKSKIYLLLKWKNQDLLNILMKSKKQFISYMKKQQSYSPRSRKSSIRKSTPKNSMKLDKLYLKNQLCDSIKQVINEKSDVNDIPKRYNRSMKKITALREQYLRDENLLKYTYHEKGLSLGTDLVGLNGRQIYRNIVQKIKRVDFTKLKKQKNEEKNEKIYEYQNILKKIENLHMQMEQQDLQHQNHLLSQYKNNKDIFFMIAAACFGIKRAHTLIIKNFSWKNTV